MTARYRDGEFRVNFADGGEATAYYTTDARDAFETAQRMWQSNAKSVAVHRERSYPGMGASPPVLRWNMYAGGTGAAEGKHAYDAMTAIGTYHIDPVHDTHGRHHGYKLRFSVAPGRSSVLPLPGLWSAIAPDGTAVQLEAAPWTFRSPQDAKRAAALHFARYGNGVTDNPGVRDIGNTVNSFHSAVQFLGGRDERKLANNTKVVRAPIVEGAVAVQLHGTFIVTYYPDGRIALNSGGYRSATTKQRLNQLLEGTSLRVEQRHYDWFVVNVRTGQRSDFVDGMVVTDPYATNPPVIARDVEAIEYVHQQDGKRYRHDFSEDRDHGRVRATVQNGGRRVVLEADDGEPIVGEYDT